MRGSIQVSLACVLPDDVNHVLIVLVANILNDFGVGKKRGVAIEGERPGVSGGIVDGDIKIQMIQIGSAVAFGHVQFFSVGMGGEIEPELVVEAYGIDYQGVAFPLSDGVAVPSRFGVWRMAAAIHKNLPVTVDVAFIQKNNQ